MNIPARSQALIQTLSERILILDGAMGTMLQGAGHTEPDFRLILSDPEAIAAVHRAYINAGADIIETCTFNANAISLAEYGATGKVRDINLRAARLARDVAAETSRPVWVAGSIGPTSKSLTMAVNLGDSISFDEMEDAYFQQIMALTEGGVDLLLIETIFDTLNAKAALHAAMRAAELTGVRLPIITSVTLTENGRTLTGQSLEAFAATVAHADPIAVMLNCGFGPDALIAQLDSLRSVATAIGIYPNAGLPDKLGQYTLGADEFAASIAKAMARGEINIAGGCCGTTPAHIRRLAETAHNYAPRPIPRPDKVTRLAGLDLLEITPENNFIAIGERCNVAGSRKFLRLISEGKIDEAIDIAVSQVEKGAQALDVNMDDGMLDSAEAMGTFVARLQVEPAAARVPLVIDSSHWPTVVAGLKRAQGRPLVNSISLKDGEAKMIERAKEIKRLGGAIVVMAFDEEGQATTLGRRIEIVTRAYNLLTAQAGIEGHEIIFDPNILTIATGLPEHDNYAIDFIEAVRAIKNTLPGAKTGGGVSNLSFAFRGNNYLREAMHAIFLHHAIAAGLDTAIVNAAALMPVDEIPPGLREAIEDVIFHRRPDATERLTEMASTLNVGLRESVTSGREESLTAAERLERLIIKGSTDGLETTVAEISAQCSRAVDIIDGPLMDAMNRVGEMFADGRMFLPQVVKSAGIMKQAVAWLQPRIEAEKKTENEGTRARRLIVLATVKGDVHDIGKNIVGILMRCNGWEVVDLGVMVPPDTIIDEAVNHRADAIGVSGLITPSLEEMCTIARKMQERGLDIPLFVGGATTSALHTAVKIAPLYTRGIVVHTRDGASVPVVATRLCSDATAIHERARIKAEQEQLRHPVDTTATGLLTLAEARNRAATVTSPGKYGNTGTVDYDFTVAELRPLLNRKALLAAWHLDPANPVSPAAKELLTDADRLLDKIEAENYTVRARAVTLDARRDGDDIVTPQLRIPTLRRQWVGPDGHSPAVADFIASEGDHVILFAVTAPRFLDTCTCGHCHADEFDALLADSVSHRLAEAATELLHKTLSGGDRTGIRPAVGYPMLPDQSLVKVFDPLLRYADMGITVTDNGALSPSATTTGLMILNPAARYFDITKIDDEQFKDYCRRRGCAPDVMRRFLTKVL